MRKFSKINETVSISQIEIESILSKLEDIEYDIFNYYKRSSSDHRDLSFIEDISNIKVGDKNAKIIIIRPKIEKHRANIDKWHENFKLNSSGFYFMNDINECKRNYNQVFELVDKLKKYSPSLCIRDDIFIIYLIGDEVDQSELKVQQDIEKAYDKLYKLLIEYSKNHDTISKVSFWREYKNLSARIEGDDEMVMTSLASLCPHMSTKGEGYKWIIDQPKDDELQNISDSINEMGFIIEFIGPKDSDDIRNSNYKFKLVEM